MITHIESNLLGRLATTANGTKVEIITSPYCRDYLMVAVSNVSTGQCSIQKVSELSLLRE